MTSFTKELTHMGGFSGVLSTDADHWYLLPTAEGGLVLKKRGAPGLTVSVFTQYFSKTTGSLLSFLTYQMMDRLTKIPTISPQMSIKELLGEKAVWVEYNEAYAPENRVFLLTTGFYLVDGFQLVTIGGYLPYNQAFLEDELISLMKSFRLG